MSNVSDVSVVICAYTMDRWNDLLAAVESVQVQNLPPREIIVVIDHNRELFARASRELNGVVIENEQQRGLSGARNSGIAVASGEFVAFLDDDATAAPDWLERLRRCCDAANVLGAGGVAEPVWQGGQPTWFPPEFLWVVGCSYRGLPVETEPVRNPYGGCCCMRRSVLVDVGGFRTDIGRVGTRPLGCEDTELSIRARQKWSGHIFMFDPHARIYHRVPSNRATWSYYRKRCFAEGLSKALVAKMVGPEDALAAETIYVRRTLPSGIVTALADVFVRADLSGFGRALGIVAGLTITGAGFVWAHVRYGSFLTTRLAGRGERGRFVEQGENI